MTTMYCECQQCPKGVVACAHLDGRVVWLTDEQKLVSHDFHVIALSERWAVLGPSIAEQCLCSVDHLVMALSVPVSHVTDSLAEAEAEFERRCALLRAEP